MRTIIFAILLSLTIQACSSVKLTPDEEKKFRERHEMFMAIHGAHNV
jgi:hypothetical protein